MNEITKMAKTLGQAISQHARTQKLIDAQNIVNNDQDAAALVTKFKAQLDKIKQLEASRQPIDKQQKQSLESTRIEINDNNALTELTKCQMEFMEMMQNVKTTIDTHLGDVSGP